MANQVNLTKSEEKTASNESGTNALVDSKFKSKFLKLPNGTRLIPTLIWTFSATSSGVSILNRQGTMIGFIDVNDHERQQQVLDLIEEIMTMGKKFVQPDWSFLN